ncbi:MAG: Eco57I restriction-modification methylase domain-containing protein, partial [Cytophagales bacterium]|nr:Eco57I restriction-modification methylase domain-containing protein [Cytophagales bacterium]
ENLLEDNKDKGAFYTPKEIVHYMCQESLIEYLTTWFENKGYEVTGYIGFDKPDQPRLFSANEGKKGQMVLEISPQGKHIDRLLIEKLLKKKLDDNDKKLVKQHAKEFHKALDQVKICDPAIGSGAFPMGLLQEIFTAKQTLWHFEHGNLKDFPASEVKLNIIQNSIYGVDIEKGAVDIARLRFWLSLVVDEDEPKPLPNLDYKIVVGNSLVSKLDDTTIEIDWSLDETAHGLFGADLAKQKSQLLKQISNEQKEFFSLDSNKKKLSADIRNLKIDLLINQLELMVKTKGLDTKPTGTGKKLAEQTELYWQTLGWKNSILQLKQLKDQPDKSLNFFDWKLDFPEVLNEWINHNPGFDIVIGNPPYIQLQKDGGKLANEYEKQGYQTFERTGDIYSLFYEKGIQLLKTQGHLTYITSNKWMRAGYGKTTRQFFLQYNPKKLIDLGSGIFESATVDTNILLIQKTPNQNQLQAVDLSKSKQLEQLNHLPYFTLRNLTADSWTISSDIEQRIKAKIEAKGKPLKEWDIQINYGIKTGYNEAFIIDGKTS